MQNDLHSGMFLRYCFHTRISGIHSKGPEMSLLKSHQFSPTTLRIRSEMWLRGKGVRSWCDRSSDRSLKVGPLSCFPFHPVFHNWCDKGRRICYPVCGMMHIIEPLLLLGKSSSCGGIGFPLSLFECSFTIYLTPHNRNKMC